MSTGDTRRPATPNNGKSTGEPAETVGDGPRGGVLPVKKATSASNGGSRGARPAAKVAGSKAAGGKTTGGKTASVKAAPVVDELEDVEDEAPARTAASRSTASARSTTATRPAKAGSRPGSGRALFAEAPAKGRPQGKSAGGKGRKPTGPVKVAESRNWGPIALFSFVGVLALAIIGYAAWPSIVDATKPSWKDQLASISGLASYKGETWLTANHKSGVLEYPVYPPVGGDHNPTWQNCMGDVYTSEISKEQAVHSLEHGAIWVTYRPDLPADQVEKLASKVRNKSYMMMSPYPGLDQPISLQTWGYQLKVSDANDGRIDQFISALGGAVDSQEPGAVCSGGITDATPTPLDMAGTGMDSAGQ